MRAMVLERVGEPLAAAEVDAPAPQPGRLVVQVRACGVCRTDLHVIDGELPNPKLPLVPGHQIVGEVVEAGADGGRFAPGDRVVFLDEGTILEEGPPEQIFREPREPRTQEFLQRIIDAGRL